MAAIKFVFDLQKIPGCINPLAIVGTLHSSKQEETDKLLYDVKFMKTVEATTQAANL